MKTLPTLTLAVAATLSSIPGAGGLSAQEPAGTIAYDYCQMYDWDIGIVCSVYFGGAAPVPDGVEPAWSPDGSHLAFSGYLDPGIFVLDLADGSIVRVSSSGYSPAWSPDGLKLAFVYGDLKVMNGDGSNVVTLALDVSAVGSPSWSADGRTIAFDCEVEAGNRDICAVGADGAGLVRLTTAPGWDADPAFSPDGSRIAFTSGSRIVVMNGDGAGATTGPWGYQPAWSPDGTRIAYAVGFEGACEADGRICSDWIYTSRPDGSDARVVASGNRPAWGVPSGPVVPPPTDPPPPPPPPPPPNLPPSASFYAVCADLTCSFNAWASTDPEGNIASYAWTFGDGAIGAGVTPSRTYASGGTYAVTLTVTDAGGASAVQTQNVVATAPVLHVGDLDGASAAQQSTWAATVTITVHDAAHGPVASAVVSGSWSDGAGGACTTTASGQCVLTKSNIRKATASVTFNVTHASRAPFVYAPGANHDADGDSTGTSVRVWRR